MQVWKMKQKMNEMRQKAGEKAIQVLTRKRKGVDGILVTVALCIVALVVCVVFKDSLQTFVTTMVTAMTNKAQAILGS